MKVGDVILNTYASERNPLRHGLVIGVGGRYIKTISYDEDGKTHVARYENYQKDEGIKVIGHIDLQKEIGKTNSKMKEKVYLFGAYMSIEKDHKTIGHGNFIHQYEHTPCIGELTNVLKKDEPLIDTVVILNLQFLTKEQFYALKGEEKQETQSDLLDKKIDECDLSIRVKNICKQNGLNTVRDVCRLAKTDWLKFHNVGKMSLSEVDNFLKYYGLDWGMNV